MSEDVLARAFEPFFTTKPVGLGTGLGLSTVRRIVDQLGGTVTIASRPGAGTRVTIAIPLVASPSAVGAAPSAVPISRLGPVHVLVVDDEPALRRVIGRRLRAAGCRVSEAGDGLDALDILRADPTVDVVLTDLIMPKMRGEELAKRVISDFPRIGVLCMSGTPGGSGGNEPWSGDRILAKPLDQGTLVERIAQLSTSRRVETDR
jgi:CheY-like chemotaxis protein